MNILMGSLIGYLSSSTQTLHSLLVGEVLETNSIHLQQSVPCNRKRRGCLFLSVLLLVLYYVLLGLDPRVAFHVLVIVIVISFIRICPPEHQSNASLPKWFFSLTSTCGPLVLFDWMSKSRHTCMYTSVSLSSPSGDKALDVDSSIRMGCVEATLHNQWQDAFSWFTKTFNRSDLLSKNLKLNIFCMVVSHCTFCLGIITTIVLHQYIWTNLALSLSL